jgi:ArsR family metal-binding transcriptional regulator
MEYLKTIIQKFIPKNIEKPLGRWRIDYCNKKINNKIDLSNEDHCGPCGQYALKIMNLSSSLHQCATKEKSTHCVKKKV